MGRALITATANVATTNVSNGNTSGLSGPVLNFASGAAQIRFGAAGTLSKLGCNVDNTGSSRSITLRKNGSAGNEVVSPTNTTAGFYQDTTHTDSVSTGDLIDLLIASSASFEIYSARAVYQAATTQVCVYSMGNVFSSTQPATGTSYLPISGWFATSISTETMVQWKIRAGGTAKQAQAYIPTNSRTGTITISSRKNTADANLTLTVGAGLTGVFTDTSNSDTLASGDLYNWKVVRASGTGSFVVQHLDITIENSSAFSNDVMNQRPDEYPYNSTSTFGFCIAGPQADFSTLSTDQMSVRHGFAVKMEKMRAYCDSNTKGGTTTIQLQVNGSNVNQTLAVATTLTGWFEDTTHTDNAGPDDTVVATISGLGAGSATFTAFGLTETDITADFSGLAWEQPAPNKAKMIPY